MTPNPLVNLMPIVLIFFVMYFVLIRPQAKQQKDLARMQAGLKKNDQVVTMGGIYGTVVDVRDETVTLRVEEEVRLKVEKTAIARRIKEG